jgi:hypothetical protein
MSNGRRWRAAGAVAAVLTLPLGACSSPQPAAPPDQAPSAASAPGEDAAQTSADSVATGGGEFCDAIRAEFALVPQLLDAQTQRDATRRRALLAQAKQANDKIIATAPETQQRDVKVVIGASNAANAALATSATVPPAVMKQFDSPEYRAASARVRSYVKDRCNIDVAPGSPTVQSGSPSRSASEPASSPRTKG